MLNIIRKNLMIVIQVVGILFMAEWFVHSTKYLVRLIF
ncbi:hypothetical protein VmeM32_00085 [Vibrio phage vB_VmeM-32]|nr:hypothetical protein VmeM32_00085 [Vibrio phage vB_VmeM-32]